MLPIEECRLLQLSERLDAIFFPMIDCLPTFLHKVVASRSMPTCGGAAAKHPAASRAGAADR